MKGIVRSLRMAVPGAVFFFLAIGVMTFFLLTTWQFTSSEEAVVIAVLTGPAAAIGYIAGFIRGQSESQ